MARVSTSGEAMPMGIGSAASQAIGLVVVVGSPRGFERQEGAPVRADPCVPTLFRTDERRAEERDRGIRRRGALMIMDYHFHRNLMESIR
jgi:hypothetical protein